MLDRPATKPIGRLRGEDLNYNEFANCILLMQIALIFIPSRHGKGGQIGGGHSSPPSAGWRWRDAERRECGRRE